MSRRYTLCFRRSGQNKTILTNLVNNALKFTPENGEVTLIAKQENNFLKFAGPAEIARVYREVWLAHALGRMDFDNAADEIQRAIDDYFARERRRKVQ